MKSESKQYYLTIESIKPVFVDTNDHLKTIIPAKGLNGQSTYDIPTSLLFTVEQFAEYHRDVMDFKHIQHLESLTNYQVSLPNKKIPLSTYDRYMVIKELNKYGYDLSNPVDYFKETALSIKPPLYYQNELFYTFNPSSQEIIKVHFKQFSETKHGYITVKELTKDVIYDVAPTLLFKTKETILNYLNEHSSTNHIVNNHRFNPSEYFKTDPYMEIIDTIEINKTYFSFNHNNSAPDKVFVTKFDKQTHGNVRVRSMTFDWDFSVPPERIYLTLEDAIPDHYRMQPIEKFIEQIIS